MKNVLAAVTCLIALTLLMPLKTAAAQGGCYRCVSAWPYPHCSDEFATGRKSCLSYENPCILDDVSCPFDTFEAEAVGPDGSLVARTQEPTPELSLLVDRLQLAQLATYSAAKHTLNPSVLASNSRRLAQDRLCNGFIRARQYSSALVAELTHRSNHLEI